MLSGNSVPWFTQRRREVLGVYEKDFYAGYPALTKNNYGEGEAYFIASENDDAFLLDFLGYLAERTGSGSGLRVNGELPTA